MIETNFAIIEAKFSVIETNFANDRKKLFNYKKPSFQWKKPKKVFFNDRNGRKSKQTLQMIETNFSIIETGKKGSRVFNDRKGAKIETNFSIIETGKKGSRVFNERNLLQVCKWSAPSLNLSNDAHRSFICELQYFSNLFAFQIQ